MELFKITNEETGKILIAGTPYTADHEWYDLTRSQGSLLYEDIQSYGIENFKIELIKSVEYNRELTYKENRKIIKDLEKVEIKKFCKTFGADNLYNRVPGDLGNTKSKIHEYTYYYKEQKYKTGLEVFEALQADGYSLTPGAVLAFLHRDKYLSERNKLLYPELIDLITIIKT